MGGLDRRGGRHRSVTVVVAVALASVAACGGGGEDDRLPPPRSPQPTPATTAPTLTLTPEEQQAVAEVRALFDEFMNAYVEVATSGERPHDHPQHRFLDRHRLYTAAHLREVYEHWQEGRAFAGELGWTYLGIVEINLDHMAPGDIHNPRVVLRYCIDATDWKLVDTTTGDVMEDGGGRYVWVVPIGWLDDRGGGPESAGWALGAQQVEESTC